MVQTVYAAITVWQPWATLIASGAKPYEFRGWPAPQRLIGRRIAVHAGARTVRVPELRELLYKLQSEDWRETGLLREPAIELIARALNAPKSLPLSSVLCTARLGAPIRGAEMAAKLGLSAITDSDRLEHSNWGWPLEDVERLEPFMPATGGQGFWPWQREFA